MKLQVQLVISVILSMYIHVIKFWYHGYHLCYMFFNQSTWTQLVYTLEYGLIWAVFPSVFFCNTLLYLKYSHITCANIEEKYLEAIQDMHVWINERSRSLLPCQLPLSIAFLFPGSGKCHSCSPLPPYSPVPF